jgi:t-SNARE complex subunit (syntaxin)
MSLEYQGALLQDINKDIIEANINLKEASKEVNRQGGQINNTLEKLEEANEDIKNSDQTMNSIIRRKKLYKIFLYGVICLELIAIFTTLIVKVFGRK